MTRKDLSYNTISHVLESWETLRRIKNYDQVVGTMLYQRLFERCPKAKVLFGYSIDADPKSPEIFQSRKFVMHASYFVEMFDSALNLLGPDVELLSEIMCELGEKHKRYGVTIDMYPIMGTALIEVLDELLREDMTPTTREAWQDTYDILVRNMLPGHRGRSARLVL